MKHSVLLLFLVCLLSFVGHSQNVAIELERMNILHIGVENPIKIVVENYSCEDVVMKTKGGVLTPTSDKCRFIYKTENCDLKVERISVGVKNKGEIKWIDSTLYAVKLIPDPVIKIATNRNSHNNYSEKITRGGLIPSMEEFYFDIRLNIQEYSVEILRNDSVIYSDENVNGYRFSEELLREIEKALEGDKLRFYNILVIYPANCERVIDGPTLIIKN